VESKTEADSNDMMEGPCDGRPSGMFGFLPVYSVRRTLFCTF